MATKNINVITLTCTAISNNVLKYVDHKHPVMEMTLSTGEKWYLHAYIDPYGYDGDYTVMFSIGRKPNHESGVWGIRSISPATITAMKEVEAYSVLRMAMDTCILGAITPKQVMFKRQDYEIEKEVYKKFPQVVLDYLRENAGKGWGY